MMKNITYDEWMSRVAEVAQIMSKAYPQLTITCDDDTIKIRTISFGCSLELGVCQIFLVTGPKRGSFVPKAYVNSSSSLDASLMGAINQVNQYQTLLEATNFGNSMLCDFNVWMDKCPCDFCATQVRSDCHGCGGTGYRDR